MNSGDTRELTFNHDEVGNRTFAVQTDQGITLDLGGYKGERQSYGNGQGHKKMNAKPWKLGGLQVPIDIDNGDLEYLQEISGSPIDAVITWQHVNGFIYKGEGSIEGDVQWNSNTGFLALEVSGSGEMKKIA